MIPANENCQRKSRKEERERHLALVRVWVPKGKVVEIRSMAVGLLKESLEDKRGRSEKSYVCGNDRLLNWRVCFRWLRLFSSRKAE